MEIMQHYPNVKLYPDSVVKTKEYTMAREYYIRKLQFDKPIIKICCGIYHCVALMDNKTVRVWFGSGSKPEPEPKPNPDPNPEPIDIINKNINIYPIADIACVDFMTMILYENNMVKYFAN